jgi:hypothetical protein
MARTKKQDSSVIRLTRWQVSISMPKKRSKDASKDEKWTLYGVEAEGNEKVYAQIPSRRWKKWSKTDPLWNQAQKAMIEHLLSNPKTRDTVIKINLKSALEEGDEEMAKKLWEGLSDLAKAELMAKPKA